jgi:hypothetical protein
MAAEYPNAFGRDYSRAIEQCRAQAVTRYREPTTGRGAVW